MSKIKANRLTPDIVVSVSDSLCIVVAQWCVEKQTIRNGLKGNLYSLTSLYSLSSPSFKLSSKIEKWQSDGIFSFQRTGADSC